MACLERGAKQHLDTTAPTRIVIHETMQHSILVGLYFMAVHALRVKNLHQSAGGYIARAQQGLLGWLKQADVPQQQNENHSLTDTVTTLQTHLVLGGVAMTTAQSFVDAASAKSVHCSPAWSLRHYVPLGCTLPVFISRYAAFFISTLSKRTTPSNCSGSSCSSRPSSTIAMSMMRLVVTGLTKPTTEAAALLLPTSTSTSKCPGPLHHRKHDVIVHSV